jgi:hypothetical protein
MRWLASSSVRRGCPLPATCGLGCSTRSASGTSAGIPSRPGASRASSEQISNPGEANPDWRQGYGYQFWMSRHGHRGELPACPGAPAPADWHPWTSGPFTIATSTAGTQVQPCLTSIEVAPRAGCWQISLIEPANTLTFPVGTGDWTICDHADHHGETIPVAASGGWLDGHTLRSSTCIAQARNTTPQGQPAARGRAHRRARLRGSVL